jgi:hypothetical protein
MPYLNLRICAIIARIESLQSCQPSFLTFNNFSLFAQSGSERQEYSEAVAVTSGQTADKTLVIIPPEEDSVTKFFFRSAL